MDVGRWLSGLGLGQYAESFAEADIDADLLAELTDADLRELGLSLGHRKRLLKAVAALGGGEAAMAAGPADTPRGEPAAERRQLTVMFVDLVGSTALSGRLDPEEMREVITRYQNTVAGEITRFEGHVAKYMGDGVLCYFGWPRAHEDAAERAARAGLAIMQAMGGLATHDGEALGARAGIATGLVVVGDLIGKGAAQEEAVVGETPNLAARLQNLAEPGQVVLSEATRRLMGDLFELRDLGPRKLKGIAEEPRAYAIVGERALESRFEAHQSHGVAAMVGREHELALLTERWRQARAGEGQMVLLTGEAGIGKSRITRGLIDAVAGDDHYRINYQCSPYHLDTALYPATRQLSLAAGVSAGDGGETGLDKVEELLGRAGGDIAVAAPLIAGLLGLQEAAEARYGALDMSPTQRRAATLEALAGQLTGLAGDKPVLFVLEDAHWIDPTTLELLELCLNRIARLPVMLLVTTRPTLQHRFGSHSIVTRLALNRLGRAQIVKIAERVTGGRSLPPELVEAIVERTDGMPLFVEELTKTVLESGTLREEGSALVLDGPAGLMAIPSSLQDSLMARLDRLQPVKEVAQTAACIGREFGYGLLAAVSPLPETELTEALDRLVEAELVFARGAPPEASYTFKHALVRDAAYESLLKAKRQQVHSRLLAALEDSPDIQPELLARHAEAAGEIEKAIGYSRKAGQAAISRPAYEEAIASYNSAIRLVQGMDDGNRGWAETELGLQVELGQALIAKRGYGAEPTAQAFRRAAALVDITGDTPLQFPVRYGNWVVHYVRAEHATALEHAERVMALAGESGEHLPTMIAHRILGASLAMVGHFAEAQRNLEIALEHIIPEQRRDVADRFGHDPFAAAHCYLALSRWPLGQADMARTHATAAENAVADFQHVNSSCYVALHNCILAFCQRDESAVENNIVRVLNLASEHGMSQWEAFGNMSQGLLRAQRGDLAGMAQYTKAYEAGISVGSGLFSPFLKTIQAETYLRHGHAEDAEQTIRRARDIPPARDECWALAEALRVEGEIRLHQGRKVEAEACYLRAIEVAQKQEAKTWELRAATSLAKLWADDGEGAKARDMLAPLHGWFTEGLDSRDMRDAGEVLESLG